MTPVLHAKGHSFRGLYQYLCHDPGAKTTHRVAWTETINLMTDRPEQAWRVMAHTAMDAPRLKKAAGGSPAGDKSTAAVLHLSLGWGEDEQGLTREEMMRAARAAIRALGASDRQALVVRHQEPGKKPHVHIMLNRVSPTDGKLLRTWNERRVLSRFAQKYEQERGEVLCPQRVIKNAARNRGEFVPSEKRLPRHLYELQKANDNQPDKERVRREEKTKDAAVAKKAREIRRRHANASAELDRAYREQRQEIRRQARWETRSAVESVRERFGPEWEMLFHQHQADLREFELREATLIGKAQSALKLIDFAAIVRSGDRRNAITEAFQALSSTGSRLQLLKRRHLAEEAKLAALQNKEETLVAAQVRREKNTALAQNRERYRRDRRDLQRTHKLERAAVRAQWKTRNADRRLVWGRGDRETVKGALSPDTAAALIESLQARLLRQTRQRGVEQDNQRDRGR